jgi:hypothetical protein
MIITEMKILLMAANRESTGLFWIPNRTRWILLDCITLVVGVFHESVQSPSVDRDHMCCWQIGTKCPILGVKIGPNASFCFSAGCVEGHAGGSGWEALQCQRRRTRVSMSVFRVSCGSLCTLRPRRQWGTVHNAQRE